MPGTYPLDSNFTITQLADTITEFEGWDRSALTVLAADESASKTMATYTARTQEIGGIAVVSTGADSAGTLLLKNKSVYIQGTLTAVDIYRLPNS
jgi:hypothetical protein